MVENKNQSQDIVFYLNHIPLEMTIYKIRKRNGSIVTFEKDKITNAIQLAFEAVQNSEIQHIPALVDMIISNVEAKV